MVVYSRNYTEERESLFQDKSFRNDIFVEKENEFYNIFFITQSRFAYEVGLSVEENGYYSLDENIVVVQSVDADTIRSVCNKIAPIIEIQMKRCVQIDGNIILRLQPCEEEVYHEMGWCTKFPKSELVKL